jgi:tetratricopeptide (TPR) repeat protein
MDVSTLQQTAFDQLGCGEFDAARASFGEAIRLALEEDGPDSLDAANLYSELAALLERINQYEEAVAAARESISILERTPDWDSELAKIAVVSQGVLSMALRALGQFDEARAAILASVAICEQYLGAAHGLTAAALIGLGVFYKYSGEFEQAEEAYQRARAILLPIHGEEGAGMALVYHNLGGLDHSRGRWTEGLVWAQKAWDITRRVHGADSRQATADAVAVAAMLDEMGPSEESATIYLHALEVWRKIYGDEHYEVATTLHNLAALRRDLGDGGEAVRYFRQAYEMKKKLLGEASPDTALSAMCLAQLLGEAGELAEAVPLARAADAAYEASCQPEHPFRIACGALLQELESASGR